MDQTTELAIAMQCEAAEKKLAAIRQRALETDLNERGFLHGFVIGITAADGRASSPNDPKELDA